MEKKFDERLVISIGESFSAESNATSDVVEHETTIDEFCCEDLLQTVSRKNEIFFSPGLQPEGAAEGRATNRSTTTGRDAMVVAFDFDGPDGKGEPGSRILELTKELPISFFLTTTFSSAAKSAPGHDRFRLLLFPDRPIVDNAEYQRVWRVLAAWLLEEFGVTADSKPNHIASVFYIGHPIDSGGFGVCGYDCPPFSVDELLEDEESTDEPIVRAVVRAPVIMSGDPIENACAKVRAAPEGSRNSTVNAAAFDLGQRVAAGEATEDVARERLQEAATGIGLGEGEARATIASGLAAGKLKPRARPLTDAGNAERLIDDFGCDLRFAKGLGWLQWDGARWVAGDAPKWQAVESARRLKQSGVETLEKWGRKSEAAASVRNCLDLASAHPRLKIEVGDLDSDPWVFAAPNGIIDLKTGQLSPADRSRLTTKVGGCEYSPEAQAPRFRQFVSEIFGGDAELVGFVQRFLGYALTGATSEQTMQLWHGHGSNGKSTLIEILLQVFGDYGQTMAPDLLIEKKHSSHPTELAELRGARFVASTETTEGRRWNESQFKKLTGGDTIRGRYMRQDFFEFSPSHKMVLATNSKPLVRSTDHAFWRRLHLVPFDQTFMPAPAGPRIGAAKNVVDPRLSEKLEAEMPGILGWLVEGCLAWQRQGLGVPDRVLAEVDAYKESQDTIGSFLAECCETGPGQSVLRAQLFRVYERWAKSGNEFCHGKNTFNRILEERGFFVEGSGSHARWVGVGILPGQESLGVIR